MLAICFQLNTTSLSFEKVALFVTICWVLMVEGGLLGVLVVDGGRFLLVVFFFILFFLCLFFGVSKL